MPKQFYLYCFDFPNGKKYIGLTSDLRRRHKTHRSLARQSSPLLPVHKAIRKYGFPLFQVLCIGSREYIANLEILTIAAFGTQESQFGYNVTLGGDLSPSQTPAVAAKISAANKGRFKGLKRPPEFGTKVSAGKKGYKHSPASIAKMRATKLGRPAYNKGKSFSSEARANMSAAQRKRPPTSPATRAKMSATRKGKPKPPFSAEHCARISAARTGRKSPGVAASNRRRKGEKRPPRQRHIQDELPFV